MAKAKKKTETVQLPKEMLDELLRVGGLMSNICANHAQPSRAITDNDRKNMDATYQQWDAITSKVRDQLKGQ